MEQNKFKQAAMLESNPKWEHAVSRISPIEKRTDDIRTDFSRDYTRLLHSNAYRRLKHKTQVFFSTKNDHICTRIEHVQHVMSISFTIAQFLGLNTELTNAIAIGHDLGHAPFGHSGEKKLKEIAKRELQENFWHEKNSLRVIDRIEIAQNSKGDYVNLNLSYAVRDGIISHCGEVDEKSLFPRDEFINLYDIKRSNEYAPYTWEGCVVKLSDKIAYLGRDIEDAIRLDMLSPVQIRYLEAITNIDASKVNNTTLIHNFIINLCKNSSPEEGIRFSEEYLQKMNAVKKFNYLNIYGHPRLTNYVKYSNLVIETLFNVLLALYENIDTLKRLENEKKNYPKLIGTFIGWLQKYAAQEKIYSPIYKNYTLYDLNERRSYCQAIIDFIASMTDQYAIELFDEQTRF